MVNQVMCKSRITKLYTRLSIFQHILILIFGKQIVKVQKMTTSVFINLKIGIQIGPAQIHTNTIQLFVIAGQKICNVVAHKVVALGFLLKKIATPLILKDLAFIQILPNVSTKVFKEPKY